MVSATLASALGLVTATRLTDVGWGWALPTVILSAISVALAVWATMPGRETVSPGDLESVRMFYADQIRVRGRLVRAAALMLAVAVLLTPLPALAATWSSPELALDVGATRHGRNLRVTAHGEHLPKDTVVTVTSHVGSERRLLISGEAYNDGRFTADAEIPLRTLHGGGKLRVLARANNRVVLDRAVEIPELD
jgi:hypothetical protein